MDNTRKADYEFAMRGLNSPNATVRDQAQKAVYLLKHETKDIANMRAALVDAHRRSDVGRIKDIHDDVNRNPQKYKNVLANNKLKGQ